MCRRSQRAVSSWALSPSSVHGQSNGGTSVNLADLKRYPERKKELLQAWDSADELILKNLKEGELPSASKRILILGDQFGALSCALDELDLTAYTDSFLSFKAIQLNSKERVRPI